MSKRKNNKNNMKQERRLKSHSGITLVALVITIVIIIILATVTINMAFGEGGLIKQAEDARDYYANDTKYTEDSLSNVTAYLNGILSGIGGSGEEPSDPPTLPTTVEEAKENETKYTDTTPITDELGNIVYIPGGFHVDKESEGTLVEDGIVIEDDDDNQFVWIPTGTYQTTNGEKTNELTRRQWGTEANVVQEPKTVSGDGVINFSFYGEGDSRSCTISGETNSINAFLESASPKSSENENGHGGFYIGRYEQGIGNVCKKEVDVYAGITRDEAKVEAESMYEEKPEIKATSQLISSYAWDTALNFICQNSEHGYTLATTDGSSYGNIGTLNQTQTGGYPADCYSNIYDLLGNCFEWTTEYSSAGSNTCVNRGGYCNISSDNYVAVRFYNPTDTSFSNFSFRLSLYV